MKLTTYFVTLALTASAVTMAAPMPKPMAGDGWFSSAAKGAAKGLKKLGSSSGRAGESSRGAGEASFGSAALHPDEVSNHRVDIASTESSPRSSPPPSREMQRTMEHYGAPVNAPAERYIPMHRAEPYPGAFNPTTHYQPPPATQGGYEMYGHGYTAPGTQDPYQASFGIRVHEDRTHPNYYFPHAHGLPGTHYSNEPGVPHDSYLNPTYGGHVPRGDYRGPAPGQDYYSHNHGQWPGN